VQDKLIILMKNKGVTQKELAQLIGITPKQFGYKIRGIAKFDGDEMFEISKYFNEKVDDIFLPTTHQNGESIDD